MIERTLESRQEKCLVRGHRIGDARQTFSPAVLSFAHEVIHVSENQAGGDRFQPALD
jgi:hypothetical protein